MDKCSNNSISNQNNSSISNHSDSETRETGFSNSNQRLERMSSMHGRTLIKRSRSPPDVSNANNLTEIKDNVKTKEEILTEEDKKPVHVSQPYQPLLQPISTLSQAPPMHPPNSYSYPYGGQDQFNVDPSQRQFPMMPPPFNMYAAMNPQWHNNQMDGMSMPMNPMQVNSNPPVSTGMDMQPNNNASMSYVSYNMPMPGDMFGMMNGMGNYCPFPMFPPEPILPPVKETIVLSSCTLYPPHPGQQIRTRERYPGCKTVFCGGLPEKITEEIIREVFDRCGEINTVRMSKKNFCHVRYTAKCYVDEAMKLSGYRMKIENKDESAYCGRLHVDYAKARDDEYEYECLQRAAQRNARHRERMVLEASRTPTPPPVVDYSDHEASQLFEKIKSEEHSTVIDAMHVLLTWLERGECTKKNANNFFQLLMSLGQSSRRLFNDKKNVVKKLDDAKSQMQQRMTFISLCFNDIYKVFETVQKSPNVLDNFSKSQKKEIEMMANKTLDTTKSHSKEMVDERVEDEMELSDGEETSEPIVEKNVEVKKGISKEELNRLRLENERVKARYAEVLAENEKAKKRRDANQEAYKKVYQEMQNRIAAQKAEIAELEAFKEDYLAQNELALSENESQSNQVQQDNDDDVSEHETLLITLVSTFLNVHPFGAGIDYICSYLVRVDPNINRTDVENLLRKFPKLFEEHSSGIGATLMKRWKFLGFNVDA